MFTLEAFRSVFGDHWDNLLMFQTIHILADYADRLSLNPSRCTVDWYCEYIGGADKLESHANAVAEKEHAYRNRDKNG